MVVPKPTKAQRDLLVWLVLQEAGQSGPKRDLEVTGGSLIPYYAERAVARELSEYAARGQTPPSWAHDSYRLGGYANHGWRRAGGTALANLEKRGYVQRTLSRAYAPTYVLTDEGRKVGRGEAD